MKESTQGRNAIGPFVLASLLGIQIAGFGQAVPDGINYQGLLTDSFGKPLETRDYSLAFSIYDAPSGGSVVWGPQSSRVPVVNGHFNVILGGIASGPSIMDAFGKTNRYLSIRIDDRQAIEPRQQLLSAPFAIAAQRALSADTVGNGVLSADGGNIGINGSIRVDGSIAVRVANETASNSVALVKYGSSQDEFLYDGAYLNHYGFGFHNYLDGLDGGNAYISGFFGIDFFTGGASRMRISRGGDIGIGTESPVARLHVRGDIITEGSGPGARIMIKSTAPGGHQFEWYPDSPAVGDLGLYDRTAELLRLAVKGNGNIGIGVDNPGAKLHVGGPVQISNGEVWSGWPVHLKTPISTAWRTTSKDKDGKYLGIGMTDTGWYFLRSAVEDNSAAAEEPVVIRNDGSVGIGTSQPSVRLHVVGNQAYIQGDAGVAALDVNQLGTGNIAIFRGGTGRVGIGTTGPTDALHVVGDIRYTGVLRGASDRDIKENFVEVDGRKVLALLSKVPISVWNFTNDVNRTRHMGPVAQDFYAAFKLGDDDKTLSSVDVDGVAMAAIQGLHDLVNEKDTEIKDLKMAVETLKGLVDELASRIGNSK